MDISFTLSDDLAEQLVQIAQSNRMLANEVAQSVLINYLNDQIADEDVETDEELAELDASAERYEAQKAAGIVITQADIDRRVAEFIELH